MPSLKGTRPSKIEGRVCWREPGEPPLFYLARNADVEGLRSRCGVAPTVSARPRARTAISTISRKWRPGDRQADRSDRRHPQGRDRQRDPRIYRDVCGHGPRCSPEGVDELADWFETLAKAGKWPSAASERCLTRLIHQRLEEDHDRRETWTQELT
jgi:hypothetical protein